MAQRRKLLGGLALSAMGIKPSPPDDGLIPATADVSVETSEAALGTGEERTMKDAATCEGRLIGVEKHRIVGWAWDSATPHQPVDVELFVGSVRVGHGRADKFDAALAGKLSGNGMHRFELVLDKIPEAPLPLTVRAVISGTDKELEPPLSLALAAAERLLAGAEYVGRVTGIENGSLCGWILNRDNPHEPPQLTLWDGDTKVLSGSPNGRVRVAIDTGAMKKAHRFELPLPTSALDGALHAYAVRVGNSGPEVAGSPVVFGPSDVASLGKVIASLSERLQKLDQRLDFFEPDMDRSSLERQMATRVLDRLDMLLHIHRDGIEREMSVMRRQISELLKLTPGANADVILPVEVRRSIADERTLPTQELSVVAHAEPLASFELARDAAGVGLTGNLKWSDQGSARGVIIKGDGAINLSGALPGRATVVLKGWGAGDPLAFNGFVAAFQGRILTGHVEIGESGAWTFVGTTREAVGRQANNNALTLTYLADSAKASGTLGLEKIVLYAPGKEPEQDDVPAPNATTVFLGTDDTQGGWYPFELSGRGGHCWMADHGDIQFRIRQTGNYDLQIPEVRPLSADIMSSLKVLSGGVPVEVEVSPLKGTTPAFRVRASFRAPVRESDLLRIRLSFPKECVKSPMELGVNSDQRLLTAAIRSASLTAIEA